MATLMPWEMGDPWLQSAVLCCMKCTCLASAVALMEQPWWRWEFLLVHVICRLMLSGAGSFVLMVQEVKINLDSSGTTASMVFQQGQHIWVASCGDSRVILCSRRGSASGKSHWHVEPLTHDHRVTCPKEAARYSLNCTRQPHLSPSSMS